MNIVTITGFVLILTVFRSCSAETANQNSMPSISPVKTELQDNHLGDKSFKNTIGLIVLSENFGKDDFVRFYNADGTLWYKFTYSYDDRDGKFEYENENFEPFSFHPDYFVLALKCVAEDSSRYEVIVNETKGTRKFVR